MDYTLYHSRLWHIWLYVVRKTLSKQFVVDVIIFTISRTWQWRPVHGDTHSHLARPPVTSHLPPFWHNSSEHVLGMPSSLSSTSSTQLIPVKPGEQSHEYPNPVGSWRQSPWLRHGFGLHVLWRWDCEQFTSGHEWHSKLPTVSTQVPFKPQASATDLHSFTSDY